MRAYDNVIKTRNTIQSSMHVLFNNVLNIMMEDLVFVTMLD